MKANRHANFRDKDQIHQRILSTRSSWSAEERERRTNWALARQRELVGVVKGYQEDSRPLPPDATSDVWAVGAVSALDLARMNG